MSTKTPQSKTQNIPKLRFGGFSSRWEEKNLSSVARIYDGTHQTPTYVKVGIPFYSVEHLTSNDFSNTKFISNDIFEKENLKVKLEKNDILMTKIGDIGTARLINWDVKASYYVSLALIKQSAKVNAAFLAQYINSASFQRELWKRIIHVAFPKKINLGEIGECKIFTSTLAEQQMIAEFLGLVDEWIENLREQNKNLESYKKGMMQKIFSQEIRFRDDQGKEFSSWEEKKLVEISEIIMGQSPDSSSYNTDGSGKYLIQGNADIDGRVTAPRNWTTQITKECRVGDIIMTVRAPVGYIAKALSDACIGRGVCAIRSKKSSDIDFLYQFLLSYEEKWVKYSQGTTFTAVNSKDVRDLKIMTPTLPEQQKIAEFLGSIDKVLESKQQQITQAEQWKKGLMQGLFV